MSEETLDFKEFEKVGWIRAAGPYRAAFSKLTVQAIEPLLEALGLKAGERLLDIACGPGDLAATAIQRGARTTGIDLSPAMITLARGLHPEIEFREGDAEALPFEDASFDVAAMNFCAGHLSDPDGAFREAHRVLDRGGRYGLSWWAPPEQTVAFGMIHRAVDAYGRRDVPVPAGPDFTRFGVPEECRRALHAAGFGDLQVRHVPMSWRVETPERLVPIMRFATVRTAALLEAQDPAALERIARAVADEARAFGRAGAVELPMPCLIATGAKT